ncbi:RING-type domain-containing protein [Caenorhabditis elegans]|uniref:RING-type domain-containing protein n=1 Tax=Caenorhabditis elegans TaxID=6239 RepID=Q9N3F9_CAEEL|nr:RING-type domain-containing protein [Caenorhabditis elegans]CCD73813.1 RING-type domain-containing protein [Caenorhabditis elegans]|eukprot:NP_497688.2 Uncharacterized protein CELE_Y53G8AR.5 [Caenorhabditis elegans]
MESADGEIEALCSIWDGVHVESKLEASRRYLKHKIKSLEDESTSASVLIEMTVSEGYPAVSPTVTLSNPRGIGEPEFRELQRQIQEIIEQNSDEMPIICQIFQHCSDFLTENQHQNMDCSICLICLASSPIIVTACDHFMHFACFNRYLTECLTGLRQEIQDAQKHMKEQVETNIFCPVCRAQLTDSNTIHNYRENVQLMIKNCKKNQKTLKNKKRRSSTTTEDVQKTIKRWHEEQRKLSKIYEKQKEKGGIIDIEEEKKRRQFFIETTTNEETDEAESTDIAENID